MFSAQNFQENTFLKTKSNFPLTGKCFPLTNFSTDKQTQKNLKNNFSKITFQKTNITLINKQKSSECVFYLDSNSNFSFSVSHFAFYCRFNLSSFALFFFLCMWLLLYRIPTFSLPQSQIAFFNSSLNFFL
jgi:hypothetical protein